MKGNEQIELQAQRYLYERAHLSGNCVVTTFDPFDVEQAFKAGAEWQKKQSAKKAVELFLNYCEVWGYTDYYAVEEFRKTMED